LIPFPWKVGDFVFRNMKKIDEFINHVHNLNLKYDEKIRGYEPNGIFLEHMLVVGFSSSFIHIVQVEEQDNNLVNPTHASRDLETVLSANELYKHREKCIVTPKNSTLQISHLMAHPSKNVINNSSSRGGDKNPPPGKIESSHKLPLWKKRTSIVQEEEEHRIGSDINRFSLEYMELEDDIENMFLNIDQQESMDNQNQSLEIVENEIFDEEESFVFQSLVFDNESKKLIILKSDVKNKKGKSHSVVNLNDMRPSQVSKIHRVTDNALDDSIGSVTPQYCSLR
jgi:hypothetical protein